MATQKGEKKPSTAPPAKDKGGAKKPEPKKK